MPFKLSLKDFSGRLLSVFTALLLRLLSNKLSTASCSMRFSLRKITSGALISTKRFKRLFRMMTRRYKSFKSDVAKRPPSSGTNGRNSGGMTGTTLTTIHSGIVFNAAVGIAQRLHHLQTLELFALALLRSLRVGFVTK